MSLAELKIRSANKELSTEQVIAQLPEEAKEFAYVVGAWVWIEFPEKPTAQVRSQLNTLGFSWNSSRGVWQHPCGVFRCRSQKYDPREVYGMHELDENKN